MQPSHSFHHIDWNRYYYLEITSSHEKLYQIELWVRYPELKYYLYDFDIISYLQGAGEREDSENYIKLIKMFQDNMRDNKYKIKLKKAEILFSIGQKKETTNGQKEQCPDSGYIDKIKMVQHEIPRDSLLLAKELSWFSQQIQILHSQQQKDEAIEISSDSQNQDLSEAWIQKLRLIQEKKNRILEHSQNFQKQIKAMQDWQDRSCRQGRKRLKRIGYESEQELEGEQMNNGASNKKGTGILKGIDNCFSRCSYFSISDNKIIRKKQTKNQEEDQCIILDHQIYLSNDDSYDIQFQIINHHSVPIFLGLIVKTYAFNNPDKQKINAYSSNAELYLQGYKQQQGSGFKEGDVVEIKASKKEIIWSINGNKQASIQKNHKRHLSYYPVVIIPKGGDAVQLISPHH